MFVKKHPLRIECLANADNKVNAWRIGMCATKQEALIGKRKPVFISAIGRDLIEATQNLLDDKERHSDAGACFKILSARRIDSDDGELLEVWQFEVEPRP